MIGETRDVTKAPHSPPTPHHATNTTRILPLLTVWYLVRVHQSEIGMLETANHHPGPAQPAQQQQQQQQHRVLVKAGCRNTATANAMAATRTRCFGIIYLSTLDLCALI